MTARPRDDTDIVLDAFQIGSSDRRRIDVVEEAVVRDFEADVLRMRHADRVRRRVLFRRGLLEVLAALAVIATAVVAFAEPAPGPPVPGWVWVQTPLGYILVIGKQPIVLTSDVQTTTKG